MSLRRTIWFIHAFANRLLKKPKRNLENALNPLKVGVWLQYFSSSTIEGTTKNNIEGELYKFTSFCFKSLDQKFLHFRLFGGSWELKCPTYIMISVCYVPFPVFILCNIDFIFSFLVKQDYSTN